MELLEAPCLKTTLKIEIPINYSKMKNRLKFSLSAEKDEALLAALERKVLSLIFDRLRK